MSWFVCVYGMTSASRQFKAARRLVDRASISGESILVTLLAVLETEWVLRKGGQGQVLIVSNATVTHRGCLVRVGESLESSINPVDH